MTSKPPRRQRRPVGAARANRPDRSEEVARLRDLLADAQATLQAIRSGQVDAVVVDSKRGPQVYTLDGAEFDYRILIESMNEGALVLTHTALILYANAHFARMVERPLATLMGSSLYEVLSDADSGRLERLLKRPGKLGATTEVLLQRPPGEPMPAKISVRPLPGKVDKDVSISMVVSDLSEVRKREDLMRSFSRALMQMQETERVQVATDLGDNLAQLLYTILVRWQVLSENLPSQETALRKQTVEFATLLRTTADEVNRISADLRPHGLEILGLASALRAVAAEFAQRMGVSIVVNCEKNTASLPAQAELTIYRVLQDALRNVENHAQARHVTVTLRLRGGVAQLAIHDDGIGFDTRDPVAQEMQSGRFGLLSMRERAHAVGGVLTVKSGISKGTEVRLDIPLSPRSATGP